MNDLIRDKSKEIVNFQEIIKADNLSYKPKSRKNYNFSDCSLPIVFLRDVHEGYLSLKDADSK